MTPRAHSVIPANPSDAACVDLVNSTFTDHLGTGARVDRVADPRWQRWFLDRYGLTPKPPGPPPLDDLVALRRDLRRILEKWNAGTLTSRDVRLLDSRMRAVPMRRRVLLTNAGLKSDEEPFSRSWEWVIAAVTGSAVDLMKAGNPHRLKVCANPACSWMFYDRTINGSRRYCSTTPCASLLRVRRFRQRG
jgi:predicted RNA-binding Zn ribbon-like protein